MFSVFLSLSVETIFKCTDILLRYKVVGGVSSSMGAEPLRTLVIFIT